MTIDLLVQRTDRLLTLPDLLGELLVVLLQLVHVDLQIAEANLRGVAEPSAVRLAAHRVDVLEAEGAQVLLDGFICKRRVNVNRCDALRNAGQRYSLLCAIWSMAMCMFGRFQSISDVARFTFVNSFCRSVKNSSHHKNSDLNSNG